MPCTPRQVLTAALRASALVLGFALAVGAQTPVVEASTAPTVP
jgi:hypothetical protein